MSKTAKQLKLEAKAIKAVDLAKTIYPTASAANIRNQAINFMAMDEIDIDKSVLRAENLTSEIPAKIKLSLIAGDDSTSTITLNREGKIWKGAMEPISDMVAPEDGVLHLEIEPFGSDSDDYEMESPLEVGHDVLTQDSHLGAIAEIATIETEAGTQKLFTIKFDNGEVVYGLSEEDLTPVVIETPEDEMPLPDEGVEGEPFPSDGVLDIDELDESPVEEIEEEPVEEDEEEEDMESSEKEADTIEAEGAQKPPDEPFEPSGVTNPPSETADADTSNDFKNDKVHAEDETVEADEKEAEQADAEDPPYPPNTVLNPPSETEPDKDNAFAADESGEVEADEKEAEDESVKAEDTEVEASDDEKESDTEADEAVKADDVVENVVADFEIDSIEITSEDEEQFNQEYIGAGKVVEPGKTALKLNRVLTADESDEMGDLFPTDPNLDGLL